MKIMIVDDEIIIRNGLATVIDWKQLGFTLLHPAESAEEALARILAEKPDLLLTDIRMGGKDGLTLAKETKELLPDLEVIMLTGYDDFSYTQQAIRQDVSDYLLKTSRPEEIIQTVLRAAQKVRVKWDARSKGQFKDKELRNLLFEKLLDGDEALDPNQLQEYFPLLQRKEVGEEVERYQVIVIKAEGWGDVESSAALLRFAVENMLSELAACETLIMKRHVAAILRADAVWLQEERYRSLFAKIEKLLKCTIYCAAGTPVGSVEEIHISYRTARQTAKYWELIQQQILTFGQVQSRSGGKTLCTRQEEAELSQILLAGDSFRLNQWIAASVTEQTGHPETTYETFASYINSIAVAVFRWLERVSADSDEFKETIRRYSVFGPAEDVSLREKLQQYLNSIMAAYHQSPSKGQSAYVQRAIAYIKENVGSQKIGLAKAARYVHLHPGHLSEVFKRETGVTFGDYVIREKLERAREMLQESSAKISEVARAVGYEDVKYFSQLFKKHYSLNPSEYREEAAGKHFGSGR